MDIAYYSRTPQRYVCIYIFVSGKSYVAELRIVYSYINSLYMGLQWDLVIACLTLLSLCIHILLCLPWDLVCNIIRIVSVIYSYMLLDLHSGTLYKQAMVLLIIYIFIDIDIFTVGPFI